MPETDGEGAPLRVLFLTQTFPRRAHDGAGPFIRDLARGLVRSGDQVKVLAPHAAGLAHSWSEDGVEIETFRYAPERFELLGYGRSLRADERSAPAALAVAPLYLLGARRAVRRVLGAGSWDLLQAHWLVPNLLAATHFAASLPLVVGLHGSDVFMAEKRFVRPWVRRALASTSGLTSCSPELAQRVETIGFPSRRSSVIPYGVDGALFRPDPARRRIWRERLGIPERSPVLLGVGRMATKKGFHDLLEAHAAIAGRIPDCHLVLAGAGDRLEEYRAWPSSPPGRVHFPGSVLHDELPDLYRAADLFVLPAVHDARGNVDGLPNVILEAMASGLPVVATRVSGLPLAVEPQRNGWLVEEGDREGLGRTLVAAIESPVHARELGLRGRQRALTEFDWDSVAARYRVAYRQAILDRR